MVKEQDQKKKLSTDTQIFIQDLMGLLKQLEKLITDYFESDVDDDDDDWTL